ncbi:hypothetical protein N7462_006373 [Penicillium macrosclerotiorum]|uniref:uncharacterized protein n=1 Tax=Penicillium macrosclerotiorum TaxID=303699 RepID=UPI002548BD90|nr:uncharacterized protein N7462_006373 [Penicillium macrosclerotiorum]KAJ5683208.1 hypothetical protein N7462_006373 [Penicillium macrosclerotiorum]
MIQELESSNMATVRLRRAFRYPDDSDGHEELDEQEQEQLIQQLQHQNNARNAQYSVIFTVISLVPVTAFLPSMLTTGSSLMERFLSLLSILSLLVTAYIMQISPLHPDRKGKGPMMVDQEHFSWLRSNLVPMNGMLGLLLTLAYLFSGLGLTFMIRPVLYLIPGALLAAILVARKTMLSVDLSTLKDLQYEYKGA